MNREKKRWKKKASSYLRLRIYNSCLHVCRCFVDPSGQTCKGNKTPRSLL